MIVISYDYFVLLDFNWSENIASNILRFDFLIFISNYFL